jgi:putative transposase
LLLARVGCAVRELRTGWAIVRADPLAFLTRHAKTRIHPLRPLLAIRDHMAPRRLFVDGLSHHVRHRGNNRCTIFHDDGDRIVFLAMLGRVCAPRGVQVHGYGLMDNHFHLQVTGRDEESLPWMMQALGRRYVRYFNRRYERTGTLFEGRYWASLILDERYWLTCMRYIERNPVAAHMVETPGEYPWTSYRHHALGHPNMLLSSHPLLDALGATAPQRRVTWSSLCGEPLNPVDLALIRESIRSGAPLCEPGFASTTGRLGQTDASDPGKAVAGF